MPTYTAEFPSWDDITDTACEIVFVRGLQVEVSDILISKTAGAWSVEVRADGFRLWDHLSLSRYRKCFDAREGWKNDLRRGTNAYRQVI